MAVAATMIIAVVVTAATAAAWTTRAAAAVHTATADGCPGHLAAIATASTIVIVWAIAAISTSDVQVSTDVALCNGKHDEIEIICWGDVLYVKWEGRVKKRHQWCRLTDIEG